MNATKDSSATQKELKRKGRVLEIPVWDQLCLNWNPKGQALYPKASINKRTSHPMSTTTGMHQNANDNAQFKTSDVNEQLDASGPIPLRKNAGVIVTPIIIRTK
jgi:hypothetical protein